MKHFLGIWVCVQGCPVHLYRITACAELEWTHQDQQVQLLPLHRISQISHIHLRALCKCFLKRVRLGVVATFLGSLFWCLATLWVQKLSLISTLNLPWLSFRPFFCVFNWSWEWRDQYLPFHFPSWGWWRPQWGLLWVSSRLNKLSDLR